MPVTQLVVEQAHVVSGPEHDLIRLQVDHNLADVSLGRHGASGHGDVQPAVPDVEAIRPDIAELHHPPGLEPSAAAHRSTAATR